MALNINSGLDLSGLAGGNPYANLTGDAKGDLAALGANYGRQQQASVGLNSQLYNNVMGGYQSVLNNHDQQAQGITGGYGDLKNSVLGDLTNLGASGRQEIADAYQQQQGAAQQNLQSRGLANSTVVDSTNRGLMYDRTKATNTLNEAVGTMKAGFGSQLGLAGLGFQGQALQQQTGLGLGQLGAMERVNVGYPQAGAYSQIAGMIGANQQAELNRQLAMQGLAQQRPQPQSAGRTAEGGHPPANPFAYWGGGQVSPGPMGGGAPQSPRPAGIGGGPRPGGFGGDAGVLAGGGQPASGYESGFSNPYGTPTGQGFAGGFGNQSGAAGGNGYDLAGEDQPYGQAPVAGYGAYQPYGWGRGGFGSTNATPGAGGAVGGGYGALMGGAQAGYSQAQESTDFYFGGDE